MKRKQLYKNIFKIMLLIVMPLLTIVGYFAFFQDRTGEILGELKLLATEMAALYHIDEDALEGFNLFPVERQANWWDIYELTVLETSQNIFPFDESNMKWLEEDKIIPLRTPQDTLYIIFENVLGMNPQPYQPMRETFVLTLFYNYEQIDFRPLNQEHFTTAFFFSLPVGYQVQIPVQLSSDLEVNDYLNALTVAVFATPERHTLDRGAYFWRENAWGGYGLNERGIGIVHNFMISYGDARIKSLPHTAHELVEVDAFVGIGFGNEDTTSLEGQIASTRSPIYLSSGETLEMRFIGNVGSFDTFDGDEWLEESDPPLESYLFVALVNWQQAEINGAPYLLIAAPDVRMSHAGSFHVQIPEEAGLYEVVVFLIANPTEPNSHGFNRNVHPRISQRFTVIVE